MTVRSILSLKTAGLIFPVPSETVKIGLTLSTIVVKILKLLLAYLFLLQIGQRKFCMTNDRRHK